MPASKKIIINEFGIKNIINYLRKSRQDEEREKKTGEDTLHEQKVLMDRVLSDYEIPYDQELEVGSGDKIDTRPVFQQVLKDLGNEKYDAIAVKEISRMGRGSYTDMGIIYDLITEKRIYIITPWKIYDPANPADLRQIRFELFMSREEFETTRERLNGGRHNAAMEGKWVNGPAPFGFNYNPNTGKLDINEKEAEIVQAIFDYYAYGIILENGKRKLVQFRALATYLFRLGIKTPTGKSNWTANQVRQLLENDRYIGVLRHNTTYTTADGKRLPRPENEHIVVYDAWPAIIDMETWEKTQYRINNRENATNTRIDFETSELAGLCVCKKCGGKFVRRASSRTYNKKDGSKSIYYDEFLFCGTVGCTYIKYRPIEEDLIEVLKYLKDLDENKLKKHLDYITEDEKKIPKQDVHMYVEGRKNELKRRMDFIYEKFESGVYTDEMFLERKAEIDKELEDLSKINTNVNSDQKYELKPSEIKHNINSILKAYEFTTSTTEKNNLLRKVFSQVVVELIEKGKGRKPAVYEISPFLKRNFLKS